MINGQYLCERKKRTHIHTDRNKNSWWRNTLTDHVYFHFIVGYICAPNYRLKLLWTRCAYAIYHCEYKPIAMQLNFIKELIWFRFHYLLSLLFSLVLFFFSFWVMIHSASLANIDNGHMCDQWTWVCSDPSKWIFWMIYLTFGLRSIQYTNIKKITNQRWAPPTSISEMRIPFQMENKNHTYTYFLFFQINITYIESKFNWTFIENSATEILLTNKINNDAFFLFCFVCSFLFYFISVLFVAVVVVICFISRITRKFLRMMHAIIVTHH